VDRVTEAHLGGFPLTRSLEAPDSERKERIGDLPSTFTDELTRQFLREADTAAVALLREHPRPLYITGAQEALALLAEVGGIAGRAVRVPHGGLAQGTPDSVWQAVSPVREDEARKAAEDVLAELEAARGRKEFTAGVDEVHQSALDGRVRLLAVEDDYRTTVRDDGDHLIPAESEDLDARDDIVDEIVEQCLETGAEVRFVPNGTLGEGVGVAGVLRY
jgi:hypothetical protein